MEKRVITIDNGGSELRYICGSDIGKVHTIDKQISIIEREGFRIKENVDPLDIVDIKKAPKSEYQNMMACGLGYYMYEGMDIGMDNQSKKTRSLAWYQQSIMAIARDAITAINATKKTEEDVIDVSKSIDYVVTTLIPVHEHSGSTDYVQKLKESLAGHYEVCFPAMKTGITEVSFDIAIEHIIVLPEGAVVVTAMRKDIATNDYSLIMDMGHNTMDLAIFKGLTLIASSVISSPYAGGTLLKLIGAVIRDHGCVADDEMCIEALKTNKFRIGKKVIDIEKEIQRAKRVFVANYVKGEVLSQIELTGISASQIQNVIPIGAVFSVVNKNSVSDILEAVIHECSLENAEVKVADGDLRYLNVIKAAEIANAFAKQV